MFDEDSCIWLIIGGLLVTISIFMADVVLTVLFVIGAFIFVLGNFSIIKSIVYKKCKNTHKVYSCCCCSLEENAQESKHETISETTIPTNTFPHTKKVNHYYDFLCQKIEGIDNQLEKGYAFSCISEEKWEKEKKKIMELLDTPVNMQNTIIRRHVKNVKFIKHMIQINHHASKWKRQLWNRTIMIHTKIHTI